MTIVAVSGRNHPGDDQLRDQLGAIVGPDALLSGDAALPYVTDVFRRLASPLAVVRPASVEDVQQVVRLAASWKLAIYPRGGGASYTDAYLPTTERSLLLDLGRLNRILEINLADAYVTVQAGVTWAQLKAALDPLGVRTPFFGPFSGLAASIGGSVSQNSISHGSGTHGISAQSVISLDVVTADGELLRTGSAARGAPPFLRFYGPDLTGLFTGDCGTLGIKVAVTLPLIRRKPARGSASFAFETLDAMASAMRELGMEGLDDEHFAIDAALMQGQIARQGGAGNILQIAREVHRAAPSAIAGVTQLARMALAGTRAMKRANFMLHVIVEASGRAELSARLRRIRAIARRGREVAATVPQIVSALPFAPLTNVLGPRGERWVPLHGIMPHSRVAGFHKALCALYATHAEEMKRLGIWSGGMYEAVGSTGFLYEVALYWPGVPNDFHRSVLPADFFSNLPAHGHAPDADALVGRLKAEIIDLYDRFGAVHFQLGKAYPYHSRLSLASKRVLSELKAALDPDGIMNPGALELPIIDASA